MKVEVKGRIATGQPLKFYCETPVPMNLHGNSPPRRDVHLVRINSVTSNERREDGEELRRRYRRKGDPRARSIRRSLRCTSVPASKFDMNALNRLRTMDVLILSVLFLISYISVLIVYSIAVTLTPLYLFTLYISRCINNKDNKRNRNCHRYDSVCR